MQLIGRGVVMERASVSTVGLALVNNGVEVAREAEPQEIIKSRTHYF